MIIYFIPDAYIANKYRTYALSSQNPVVEALDVLPLKGSKFQAVVRPSESHP